MKPVRTQPRFKCDYCLKRSTRATMAKHEPRCFRNPNRFCDYCKNTGMVEIDVSNIADGNGGSFQEKCHYCEKFNPQTLAEIQAYEMEKEQK